MNYRIILLMVSGITVAEKHANAQWAYNGNDIYNTNSGNVHILRDLELHGVNNGAPTLGALRFGFASGEAIASKRTAGGNQFGLDFYTRFANRMSITNAGDVELLGENNGAPTLGALRFGLASGEAIASKRTAGGNQFGLDFYTNFNNRMSITNAGDVEILGNNNGAPTLGALRFGLASGEAIASKRTAGGNQYGLDFYTAFANRMSITSGGDVEILGNNNGAPTLGALRFGIGSGEAIASKRTSGGNQYGLDFYTAFINRMTITSGGNVGIGTASPVRKLQVAGDERLTSTIGSRLLEFFRQGSGGSRNDWRFEHTGSSLYVGTSTNDFVTSICNVTRFGTCGDTYKFTVYGKALASAGTWVNSDLKLKRNINDLSSAMNIVKQLKPKTYFYKSGEYLPLNLSGTKQYGFIAQDVEKVLPGIVESSDQPVNINGNGEPKTEKIKSLNYTALIPVLTKAIQEQQQQIEKQQQQIQKLEGLVSTLLKGQSPSGQITDVSFGTPVIATNAILEQITPNPLSTVGNVRYYIPVSSQNAQLIITDNLGRTVKQVRVASGNGVINIDASALSSGTYVYALWADGKFIKSQKMIVIRQ